MHKPNVHNLRRSVLPIGLFLALVLVSACSVIAHGVDAELDYENFLAIKVYPDESIVMTMRGGYTEAASPWEEVSAEGVELTLETSTEGEVTEIDSRLSVRLNPSTYSSMANMDIDIGGHSDDTYTNLTLSVDYPGYVGISGGIGIVVVDPPYGLVLDLDLEMELYYTFYPQESIEMMLAFIPILETQIAAQVMEATDGHISLERLEILDLVEGVDSASFTARLSLAGDIQKGLQAVAEGIGAEITELEEPGEASPLTIESFDFHLSFDGGSLTLEAENGGTVVGDFNGQLNNFKDTSLEQLLNNIELDDEERTLVARAMPIDLDALNTRVEMDYSLEDDVASYTFSLDGLGLMPPSFETLLTFLGELSKQDSLGDFKLVLEGETVRNQYVTFNAPDETKAPMVEEEGMLVWELDDIENLEEVTSEVKTRQASNTTTVMAVGAAALLVVGALAFLRMRQ
jgi:hypothetical protein